VDLSTRYLGFELPHPLMPGASPLAGDLDTVKRLEDAGAAAIVMHSLFEEQIVGEELATAEAIDTPAESFGEALSYFPNPEPFTVGPQEYLERIRRIKEAVGVPVIASLNGVTEGGCRPVPTPWNSTSITWRRTWPRPARRSSSERWPWSGRSRTP